MTLRDISVAMGSDTPEWPGDTPFSCGWTWSIAAGASVNVSAIVSSPHVGTHADAPLHVRDGGSPSEALRLEAFVGRAIVLGARSNESIIELDDLSSLLPDGPVERLLLRTGHSIAGGTFPDSWPALSVTAVELLLERGLQLLGVDAPSVDSRESRALEVHHALFRGGACNLENLDLTGVADGEYELIALPVRVMGVDAAPVRAVLLPPR